MRSLFSAGPLALAFAIFCASGAPAQQPPPRPDPQAELQAAATAALQAQKVGPLKVDLLDQAQLALPDGYAFIPRAEGGRLMRALGNRTGDDLVGVIFGDNELGSDWFAVVRWEKSGYIKDDDAKHWNADDLLKSLKEGTEQSNEERRQRGFPEIEVLGWVEKPTYDSARQRLIWSASSRRKGDTGSDRGVNYNTYALGREGYFSLNLVTGLANIERDKPAAHRLLGALEYREGKRYGDFNPGTDHVAEYGIAALVAGAAAKKLGLFAAAGVFLLKFWKLFAIGAVVAGGGLFKLFRRR